jgi:cell division protein FtsZ
MLEMGKAMMGTGEAEGERRAIEAAEAAINNPLLDDISMKGARGVIINVTGGLDMTLFEVDEACNRIRDEVDPNANIIFGSTFDDKMEGRMRVSVVATGIDAAEAKKPVSTANAGGVRVTAVGKPQPEAAFTKPVFERAKPQVNTIQAATVAARTVTKPAAPVYQPAKAYVPDEPERDMFEQQEFAASAASEAAPVQTYAATQQPSGNQAAGLRGTLHDGHFIPPKAVTPEPQEPASSYAMGGFIPQSGGQGYSLRPPVPGASAQQAERKKTPSLFERITSGVRQAARHANEEENFTDATPQAATGTGGFHNSLRAAPRVSENPAQGQLNIDAPAATRAAAEGDLDIPAFLRRQAN